MIALFSMSSCAGAALAAKIPKVIEIVRIILPLLILRVGLPDYAETFSCAPHPRTMPDAVVKDPRRRLAPANQQIRHSD
ncbi:hypothetical protein SPHINGOT1_80049 [Sphingomonas sp. T1]|nr:hypothetical protein SPHINGOT1_80049 [Sphingomonas sp. T1]